jgi:hypothetical protein
MFGVLAVIVIIGVAAAGPTDTILIDLNVTQEVSIDVSPNTTSWYGVSIGETTSPNAFDIQNVGSSHMGPVLHRTSMQETSS